MRAARILLDRWETTQDRLRARLHPLQLAFVADASKRKAALCSRRAGKTQGVASWLVEGAESAPGGMSLYVALRRANARGQMWAALRRLSEELDLGYEMAEIDGQLMVRCPNGHQIWLAGCHAASEMEKFRGYAFRRVAIDECASLGPYLHELVEDVLDPALLDTDGEIALTGTPGAALAGYFYEVTQHAQHARTLRANDWSVHQWTVLENPYIPHAGAWLRERMQRRKWDESHPTYVREWRGLWVRDEGALVYPYDPLRNDADEVPEGEWLYGLGIDLGYEDSTAFVVGAYRRNFPELYLIHAEKREHMIPSAVAGYVEQLRQRWRFSVLVADEGGLGKGYAEEMRQAFQIPVKPADKTRKRAYQEMVAGDLRSGVIKVLPRECRALTDEWRVLQWDQLRVREDARFENHAADAALYLCRALHPYYRPQLVPPEVGSEGYYAELRDKERREARKRAEAKHARKWRERHSPWKP